MKKLLNLEFKPRSVKQYKKKSKKTELNRKFESRIFKFFKQNTKSIKKKLKLNLRKMILLNSQSIIDLFCNRKLINKSKRYKNSIKLRSYSKNILMNQKTPVKNYYQKILFSKKTIINIFFVRLDQTIQNYV